MTLFERIYRSNFFIKLRHWEFWPFGIIQAPFVIYWLWLSLKARSFFFFSASNPSIFSGGMLGESKFEVLNLVPQQYRPKAVLLKLPATINDVRQSMEALKLTFPIIFKPDMGERGWMVQKIENIDQAQLYLSKINTDFIIQEFIDFPLEFGVFYVRMPGEETGKVISINSKEMLHVVGNGKNTLEELVFKNDRAKLQAPRLKTIFRSQWQQVISIGELVELNSIGNHCLGTKFLNSNHLINSKLTASFNTLSKQIDGFYFGRYDLRCANLDDLENGRFLIMELNGCGAEPAHIYQPGYSLFEALRVLYRHWRTMYEISTENHRRGVPYLSFAEAKKKYIRVKAILGKS